MLVKLPNGLIDGQDVFNYVEIDEIRGKQQNYLADKDLVVDNIGHVTKLLEDLRAQAHEDRNLIGKKTIERRTYTQIAFQRAILLSMKLLACFEID